MFAGIPANQAKKMLESPKLLLFVIVHLAKVILSLKTQRVFKGLLCQRVLGGFSSLKIETLIHKK